MEYPELGHAAAQDVPRPIEAASSAPCCRLHPGQSMTGEALVEGLDHECREATAKATELPPRSCLDADESLGGDCPASAFAHPHQPQLDDGEALRAEPAGRPQPPPFVARTEGPHAVPAHSSCRTAGVAGHAQRLDLGSLERQPLESIDRG